MLINFLLKSDVCTCNGETSYSDSFYNFVIFLMCSHSEYMTDFIDYINRRSLYVDTY